MSSVGSIPFTAYDFFAYLAEGFVMLLAIDAAFIADPSTFSPSALETLILIAAAYTLGQLVDQLAGGLMETLLFDKTTVGFPSVNLFVERTGGCWVWRWIFNAYWRSVPNGTRERIFPPIVELPIAELRDADRYRARVRRRSRDERWRSLAADGETLYDHCYGTVKAQGADSAGLGTLVNVYTFCRNMSVALMLGAIAVGLGSIFVGSAHTGPEISPGWWIGGALFTAGGLFLRYLKIFRLFHEEIFTTYAALRR